MHIVTSFTCFDPWMRVGATSGSSCVGSEDSITSFILKKDSHIMSVCYTV
jgi:hypothetical protein